jgi:uncharacterized membrane protein YcaP (DUF421 family)
MKVCGATREENGQLVVTLHDGNKHRRVPDLVGATAQEPVAARLGLVGERVREAAAKPIGRDRV